jgi:hypothetical protein
VIGVDNVHEFYTNHYVAAIVGADVKPHLQRWRDDPADAPWRRLGALQGPFFRFLEQRERARGGDARVRDHAELTGQILEALGYALQPVHRELPSGPVPLLAAYDRPDGEPLLWLLPAPTRHGAEEDVLNRALLPELHSLVPGAHDLLDRRQVHRRTVEELVTEAFGLEDPPRFVLVIGDQTWVLADRGKWAEQRMLRFDWSELLGRRETDALEVVTALLHRETLAPESGASLVDTLDDSSHKHAFEVSEDLKAALQASIEAIGNEAIRYRREVSKQRVYGEEIDGQQLAIQCIRYMYRILFLLYIEARPELGYAPMGAEAYRLGYSLDRLRDLEMVELETPEARDGFYLDACLKRLFRMVYDGTGAQDQLSIVGAPDGASVHHTFRMVPLRSHLFDPSRTPFLNQVKLRNEVLLGVIQAMSLSAPKGSGTARRRGRISYATLGIHQLGAVYEALLSFRGFFAEETLYEVKPDGADRPDPVRDPAYFVPVADLPRYSQGERVYSDDGQVRSYPPGSFIYRMAGRDRQQSASYYTPEVLTKCLVKYALEELLQHEDGTPRHPHATDLLRLTLCEPAMGSAAFLNEAVNQLAERYLHRRQAELGARIPHDQYAYELQRVRMYIADNNVHGVDLNPIALELAEVSLWLNAIFTDTTGDAPRVFVPWFGAQLCTGNSLVGARRRVFKRHTLSAGKDGDAAAWLDAVPDPVALSEPRPDGSVYQFLLPDRGMAVYGEGNEGKPIQELCADPLAAIEAWRADVCRPLSDSDRKALGQLSDAVDRLWARHIELLEAMRARTTDPLSVYGHAHPLAGKPPSTTEEKDRIWSKEMASEQVRASSPYRRLKLAMDYWCALWFWPIEHAELLPDRDEWLADLSLLLDAGVLPGLEGGGAQRDLFAPTMPADDARSLLAEVGFADVERLITRWPRLQLADALARRYRFHHWELEFADVFAKRGGFDLMLGNPPWIRVQWSEQDVLGDADPAFVLKKLSATQTADRRAATLAQRGSLPAYLAAHEAAAGTQAFLSAAANYPVLSRVKVNLYKGFLPLVWDATSAGGVAGLLHPEGVYDDPKGGALREALYPRLRRHYQFVNELQLFPEVDHHAKFSANIYGPRRPRPRFVHIANVFTPATIDSSHAHLGRGPVPGIKEDGAWALGGHRSRVIEVGPGALELFAKLYDDAGTPPLQARLPALHSRQMLPALEAFANARTLADLGDNLRASDMWNETRAQRAGTIRAHTSFPESPAGLILSGPHFFVGNPHYKTPRAVCTNNSHYDALDLTTLPADYLPRTNYVPACTPAEYAARTPKVPWAEGTPVTAFYRVVTSRAVSPPGERTLQPAIASAPVGHIDGVYSYAFASTRDLLTTASTWASVPMDFFVKSTGSGDFRPNLARQLPLPTRHLRELHARTLLLNCLTSWYAELWRDAWDPAYRADRWAKEDPRLPASAFTGLGPAWTWQTPLRTDYARRQALVEIDVLVAMALGLTLDQLQTLYRAQFYVLRGYEDDTWYDRNGRIVFTASKGLVGVGLPRSTSGRDRAPCWNDVKDLATGTVTRTVIDDTLPGGPRERTIVYEAPFDRCDRERDYAVAWRHFADRFAQEEG